MLDNVVLSLHIAGHSCECAERMAIACVDNLLDFFADRIDWSLVVNREAMGNGQHGN